jgi:hypothetical protein
VPIYQFRDEQSGEIVDRYYAMADAPEVGSVTDEDGNRLCRIVSEQAGIVHEYRHVSHSLPRVDPNDPYWPHFDEKNRPVFTSKKQVGELQARIAHMGGGFRFE